jgi:hypothetical protein
VPKNKANLVEHHLKVKRTRSKVRGLLLGGLLRMLLKVKRTLTKRGAVRTKTKKERVVKAQSQKAKTRDLDLGKIRTQPQECQSGPLRSILEKLAM